MLCYAMLCYGRQGALAPLLDLFNADFVAPSTEAAHTVGDPPRDSSPRTPPLLAACCKFLAAANASHRVRPPGDFMVVRTARALSAGEAVTAPYGAGGRVT